jgi:hypothetical protein
MAGGARTGGKQANRELAIRAIKVVDIGYVSTIYFLAAFFLSVSLDRALGKFEPAERTPTFVLLLQAAIHIWFLGVLSYVVKNLVEMIPFPLDGVKGYQHSRLGELHNATLFSVVVVAFQKNLAARLLYLYTRFTK